MLRVIFCWLVCIKWLNFDICVKNEVFWLLESDFVIGKLVFIVLIGWLWIKILKCKWGLVKWLVVLVRVIFCLCFISWFFFIKILFKCK